MTLSSPNPLLRIRVHFAVADGSSLCKAGVSKNNRFTTYVKDVNCPECRYKIGVSKKPRKP